MVHIKVRALGGARGYRSSRRPSRPAAARRQRSKPAVPATRSASATASGSPAASPAAVEFGRHRPGGIRPGRRRRAGHLDRGPDLLGRDQPGQAIHPERRQQRRPERHQLRRARPGHDVTAEVARDYRFRCRVGRGIGHFARNLNAYCSTSGVTDVGAAAVPLLKEEAAAEFQNAGRDAHYPAGSRDRRRAGGRDLLPDLLLEPRGRFTGRSSRCCRRRTRSAS